MQTLRTALVMAAVICLALLSAKHPAVAASSHVDCSDEHWVALLQQDDTPPDNDHADKVRAMVTAGDTRAACLDNAGSQYASMVDDAANQYDSAADEAFLMGDETYACILHRRALRLENIALARHLSGDDRRLVTFRRTDTLRSMRVCH